MRPRRISALGTHTFVSKIIVYALGAVTSVVIARALGPGGRGQYYLPVTMITVAYYVANLGTQQAQFRLWSHRAAPREAFLKSALIISAGVGLVGMAATWGAYRIGRSSVFAGIEAEHVLIVLPLLPFLVHSLLQTGLLMVTGRLVTANIAMIVGAAIQMIGTLLLFVVGELAVESVLLLYAIGVLTPWLIILRTSWRPKIPLRGIPWRLVGDHLKIGIQVEPNLLFSYLNLRIDVFFIAQYLTVADVGIYSIAVIFGELIWLTTDSVTAAIAERQANAPHEEAADVTKRAVRMNLVLSVVTGTAIALAAVPIINIVFGSEFSDAAKVVWPLLPAAAAMAIWRPANTYLVRFAPPWIQPVVASASLLVNIVANIILIPRLDLVGAALASTISYSVGALLAIGAFVRNTDANIWCLLPRSADLRQVTSLLGHERRRELVSMFRER